MRMYDIILKKRANVPLTDEEIRFVIDGYVKGDIPDSFDKERRIYRCNEEAFYNPKSYIDIYE